MARIKMESIVYFEYCLNILISFKMLRLKGFYYGCTRKAIYKKSRGKT